MIKERMGKRLKSGIKIAAILLIAIFLCVGIYYLVDRGLNGVFLDWFDREFHYTTQYYDETSGAYTIYTQTNWILLKGVLFYLLLAVVLIVIIIVLVVSYLHGKKVKRETISEAGRLIQTYMAQELPLGIFPDEYSELSAKMAEIRGEGYRKEQLLKEEATRKNDLITYLAHDLKTPLTSVVGYLSLLDEAPDMPLEQKAKYIHISLEKALRLEKLINEFFEITRYNLQQITLEKETVDLSYMLVQMTDEFYPILREHGNTVELNTEENLMVYADVVKLARVFNNILKNAVAYSYQGTPIRITAKQEEKQVVISFCNSGKTIPKQKLESIFEKFFRLDDARTTNTGGAGLGLAIAREIVKLHGGTITAESENETTEFRVTLLVD